MRFRLLFAALLVTLLFSACQTVRTSSDAPAAAAETPLPTQTLALTPTPVPTPSPTPSPSPTPGTVSLSLRFVGDLMCCNYQIAGARQADGGYDFAPPFALVKSELAGADLLLGNFETNIVPDEPVCGDKDGFNAPVEYLDAVKALGFDVLFTANNHALDLGVSGALSTLEAIKARDITPVGTNATPEDAKRICVKNVNGLNVAILAYADRTNKKKVELDGEDAYWAFNYFTEERLRSDVALAKEQGAEMIVMYLHEGREKLVTPNKYQIRDADWAFDAGVDLVVMSHTHSLLTMAKREIETEKGKKQVFCAYGLGNFMSSAIHTESLNNVILNFDVTYDRNLGGLSALDAEYLLTYTVNYYDSADSWQFLIVPMEKALSDYSIVPARARTNEKRMQKAYSDMRKRLDTYGAAASVSTLTDKAAG